MGDQGASQGIAGATVPDFMLLKAVIESVADAVVVTSAALDPPGPVIEYVNAAFTAMTGYAADEVVGRSPRLLQGPETDQAILNQLRADLRAGKPSKAEVVNYRQDGSEYIVEWLITALRNGAGQVRHWVAVQRDVTERRRMEERQRVLIAELQHRTRNLLAIVMSIAERTVSRGGLLDAFSQRLAALGRVQGLLSRAVGERIDLGEIVRLELSAIGAGKGRITVGGPAVPLGFTTAQTIALALHELATNAFKYGALAQSTGRLKVTWSVDAGQGSDPSRLVLLWREGNVPLAGEPLTSKGYGRELIERALPYQLDAETRLQFTPDGVHCDIAVLLAAERYSADA